MNEEEDTGSDFEMKDDERLAEDMIISTLTFI